MGFAKAFGYGNIPRLTKKISKPMGRLWFVTTVLFMATTFLLIMKREEWWMIGLVAIILSQILLFTVWKDAKVGSIANGIILMFIVVAFGTWRFSKLYAEEVTKDSAATAFSPDSLLTEADIQHLPEPVKKYIRYTGSVDKPKVKSFKVEFVGQIRKNEQSSWMPFSSQQYNFMDVTSRLFFMKATMNHLPVAGFHSFKNGQAFMDIRLLSLFRVQYQTGQEMGIAETVTFFNDMCCMAPATLIDNRIKWIDSDDHKVNASLTNNGITISATLYFNDVGELTNFISEDRYAAGENNMMKKIKWSTPLKNYKMINGYKLAGYADTIYHYPEGDLGYGTFSLTNVEYNPTVFR